MRKTSIETYNKIKNNGMLSRLRWTVYDYIFNHGPCSMMQANLDLNSGKYSNGSYTSRFSELKHLGVIEEVSKYICPHTNQTVILWDITEKIPLKISKKDKLIKDIEKTKRKLNKLENLLNLELKNE